MQALNLDSHWQAVMTRDRRADGSFVYAVRSTGIFCRPSCASRRPQRDRVSFFPSPHEARQAGYRACRRCHPESAQTGSIEVVQRVCRFIDAQQDGTPSLSDLATHFGLSASHLARSFKAAIGMTPKAYADLQRIERLKQRLRDGESVTSALYGAGYGSSSRLYEQGNALMGMTPADYRRTGSGALISFTIVNTTLGRLLVAVTERGVCMVSLGDSDVALEQALRQEYCAADVQRDDRKLSQVVAAIVRHVENGEPLGGLALDIQATAFKRKVWKALAAIPYGQTRTYGQIAASIGHPTSARAVGQACASNPLALIIPCHRAVPRAGGSGGYRWGAARKRMLLDRERRARANQPSTAAARVLTLSNASSSLMRRRSASASK